MQNEKQEQLKVKEKINMEVIGIKIDYEKFDKLKKERWEVVSYRCKLHNTFFSDEPCWQCYEECREEI